MELWIVITQKCIDVSPLCPPKDKNGISIVEHFKQPILGSQDFSFCVFFRSYTASLDHTKTASVSRNMYFVTDFSHWLDTPSMTTKPTVCFMPSP